MEKFEVAEKQRDKKTKGIPLKFLSNLVAASMVVISVFLVLSVVFTFIFYRQMIRTSRDYVEWREKAGEMLVASDYLTEQVRTFVETGDRKHMQNYFTEANVTKRRDHSLAFIKEIFPNSESYLALEHAMAQSMLLMETEFYAMRLKAESMGDDLSTYPDEVRSVVETEADAALSAQEKGELARARLFNKYYIQRKTEISSKTNACLDELILDLDARQRAAETKLNLSLILELALILLFIVLSGFVVVVTSKQVFDPLIRYIPFIESDSPLPVQGAYELRILADTYNSMYEAHRRNSNTLKFRADHDALTGVLNRGAFEKLQTAANDGKVAFLMLDIDNFKKVNDTCGHLVGDKVLIRIVTLLRERFRAGDNIFRIGGDEFAVVMFGVDEASKDSIREKIDAINEILATEKREDGEPAVSLSAGVAFGNMIDKILIEKADGVLYERKKSGKAGCSFYKE